MNFINIKKVLLIVAHPDDAEIAVGGLILLLTEAQIEVYVCNFTLPAASSISREKRKQAAKQASKLLGYNLLWIESGKYSSLEEITEQQAVYHIENIISSISPDIVITHTLNDSHVDHVKVSKAVFASSRLWNKKINFYIFGPNEFHTPYFIRFKPNIFFDTTKYMDKKIEAINLYNISNIGYRKLKTKEIELINSYYGLINGTKYAEVLKLITAHY